MKRTTTIAAIALSGGVCFAAGFVTSKLQSLDSSLVMVEIENASGTGIAVLRLTHKNGIIEERGLRSGASRRWWFAVAGEGAYALHVELGNGEAFDGGAGYVESGYRVREVVREHGVESKYSFMQLWP